MATWSDYLASAGGSAVSGLIGGLFNQSSQKKQNKFAAEQAELDREFQAEQAQLANEFTTSERLASQQWEEDWYNNYSSPSAMVSQYEEAGLNPALMYGQAGASIGDTPSAPSGESGAYASGSKASPLQGLSSLDYLQFAVDAFSKITSAIKTSRESRHQQMENDVFDFRLGMEYDEHNVRVANVAAQTDGILAGIKKTFSDIDLNRAQIRDYVYKAEVYKSEIARNSKLNDLSDAQIADLACQASWYQSQIERNSKLNDLSDAQISNLSLESARLQQLIFQSDELFPSQKELQELGVDRAKAEKTYEYFFPQILQEYNSKIANIDMDTEQKEASVKQILEDLDYSKFEHDYAKSTGWNFDAKGVIGHLFKLPANLLYALDSVNSALHDFSNSSFNHPTY